MNPAFTQAHNELHGGEHKTTSSDAREKTGSIHSPPGYATSPVPNPHTQIQPLPQAHQQPQAYQMQQMHHTQPVQQVQQPQQVYEHYQGQPQAYQTYYTQPMQPPQGYSIPQQPKTLTNVHIQSPQQPYLNSTPIRNLGMSSTVVDCPTCGQRGMTNVTYHAGNTTHIWAGVLCFLTLFFCWVPYLMNGLKDVQHRCSVCGTLLATWHKSGSTESHVAA